MASRSGRRGSSRQREPARRRSWRWRVGCSSVGHEHVAPAPRAVVEAADAVPLGPLVGLLAGADLDGDLALSRLQPLRASAGPGRRARRGPRSEMAQGRSRENRRARCRARAQALLRGPRRRASGRQTRADARRSRSPARDASGERAARSPSYPASGRPRSASARIASSLPDAHDAAIVQGPWRLDPGTSPSSAGTARQPACPSAMMAA